MIYIVLLAKKAGHCFGVKRALDIVGKALEEGSVETLGPLIHNPRQIEKLEGMGAKVVSSVKEASGDAPLVLRSHGIKPGELDEIKKRGLAYLDATCPHVTRIHELVRDSQQKGVPVIILGEATHAEVEATRAWAGKDAFVVEREADALRLPAWDKACVVAQTTLPESVFKRLASAVKTRIPEAVINETICEATKESQAEADDIARRSDVMLIIGGKNSSNTRKLLEIARKHCPAHMIESAQDIPWDNIPEKGVVGVAAGTSTPDWIIKEVLEAMSERQDMDLNPQIEAEAAPAEQPVVQEAQAQTPEVEAQPPQEEQEPQETAAPTSEESFMEAYEKTFVSIKPGQIVKGSVVQITADEVCVNIGYKSDGIVKRSDLAVEGEPLELFKIGDMIEVEVVKVNDGEGNVLLSQRNVVASRSWDELVAKNEAGEFIEGVGREVVKGGLIANVMGVRAFIPASHLSERYVENIQQFVGQTMNLKIIEMDERKKRIVASRKAVIAVENESKRQAIWENINEGDVIKGVVRRISDFGAFVDIGGVDGLVHVTELSWGRVAHPSDVVKVGDEIDVVILRMDQEKGHISLGYKQLLPKPWDNAEERYQVGSIVQGKVMRIVTFGAFVELEPGLDGLVHISQVSDQHISKVEDALSIGDIVNVKVLEVNLERRRISLSVREAIDTYGNPVPEVAETMPAMDGEYDQDVTAEDGVQYNKGESLACEQAQEPSDDAAPEDESEQ